MNYTQLDHFVLVTINLQACLGFYVGVLGLKHEQHNGHHSLRIGNQKINIHTRKGEFEPYAKNPAFGSEDFCIIIEGKIEDCMDEITAKGGVVELGPVERHGAMGKMRSIYLRDPDGNLVEIASYCP